MKIAGTSDEVFELMNTGDYDVVSASGDASLRLIYGGNVAPVNTALLTNYADIFAVLKGKPWNSVDGVDYGIPHGWGANLLCTAPTRSRRRRRPGASVFDANSPYKGKVTRLRLADLPRRRGAVPDGDQARPGITNPYALDQTQFDAAVDAAHRAEAQLRRVLVRLHQRQKAFKNGTYVIGTSWQIIVNLAQADKAPVDASCPRRARPAGRTPGWSTPSRQHPNCAYLWMNHIITPEVNAAGRRVVR